MGQRRKKIPPTPDFELQVTWCLVGATLASLPDRFFSLNKNFSNEHMQTEWFSYEYMYYI